MTAPGNDLVQIVLALAFVITSGYAAGRIHQWYKHGLERDDAYREGYNEASHSMFDMAVRSRPAPTPAARAVSAAALPSGPVVRAVSAAALPSGPVVRAVSAAALPPGPASTVGSRRRRIVRT